MHVEKLRFQSTVLIAILGLGGLVSFAQVGNEQASTLHALSLSYGASIDDKHPRFRIKPNHLLVPTFSADGVLIKVSIEPKITNDPTRVFGLPRPEFDAVLATLGSIKPLGTPEPDDGPREMSGWRVHKTLLYGNAYLRTAEKVGYGDPAPIESAEIYYIHSVTGMPRIAADEMPDRAGRYRLICFDDAHYLARETEFFKLWSKSRERQTVDLAGPTDSACSPDEELYKGAKTAIADGQLDVANLTLRTLLNTYPDSEYAAEAKALLASPQISKCGEGLVNPRTCNRHPAPRNER